MAEESQSADDTEQAAYSVPSNLIERGLKRHQALARIQADIIAHRGTLEGIVDEFLDERREEVRRELEECQNSGSELNR